MRQARSRSSVVIAGLALVLLALSTFACSAADKATPDKAAPDKIAPGKATPTESLSATARPSRTLDYLPGRAADVYLPSSPRSAGAVVLLVPGGGWQTADRTGLGALATRLSGAGIVAVNVTYRAAADGVVFPAPVEDLACAAAFAAQQAATAAGHHVKLVVLGHSAGAQLGALVALSREEFRSDCPYPYAAVNGLVGIAGPYDVRAVADVAGTLFGAPPDEDVDAWRRGDPYTWVAGAPRGLRVLLLHGDADRVVSPYQSEAFAAALTRAGISVELRMVKGADHLTVFQPSAIAATVIAWIRDLVRLTADQS